MTRTLAANLVDESGDLVIPQRVWLGGGTQTRHQITQLLARQGLVPRLDDKPALDAPHAWLGSEVL
jgi:hypothetical protein